MQQEPQDKLLEKYPKIFPKEIDGKPSRFWGFEHGAGWYNILNSACFLIQSHIDRSVDMSRKKPEEHDAVPQVVAAQIKEKFGSMRFYVYGGDDYTSGVVAMAESMSCVTCEECGDAGEARSGGWLRTLCDVHNEEYEAKRSNNNV